MACVRGPKAIRVSRTDSVCVRFWPFHNVNFEYKNNLRDMKQFENNNNKWKRETRLQIE